GITSVGDMVTHRLTKQEARRIAIHAQLLDSPRPTDVVGVVDRLTFLQIDPTAAIAPSADLVLWSRIGSSYDPADLVKAVESDRSLVETVAYIRSPRHLPAAFARHKFHPTTATPTTSGCRSMAARRCSHPSTGSSMTVSGLSRSSNSSTSSRCTSPRTSAGGATSPSPSCTATNSSGSWTRLPIARPRGLSSTRSTKTSPSPTTSLPRFAPRSMTWPSGWVSRPPQHRGPKHTPDDWSVEMAHVVLFHHTQGLTDGVRAFADELR